MAEKGSTRALDSTCTRTTHSGETSPGKKAEEDSYRLTRHFKDSMVNKGKPAKDKAKTNRDRVNQEAAGTRQMNEATLE